MGKTLDEVVAMHENEGQAASAASLQDDVIQKPEVQGLKIDFSFLKTPTGEGEIEDYLNHTLNFNKSVGLARIIRGLTGFMGNINLAVVDILLGVLEFSKGKPKTQNNVGYYNQ